MLSHFNILLETNGETVVSQERFQGFIAANFHKIITEQGGDQVLFTLQTNDLGQVEILAQAAGGGQGAR
jgi:DNA repair ATPase RecN